MEEDDISISPYDDGSWEWDDANNRLEFKSNINEESQTVPTDRVYASNILKSLEFSDSPDLYDILRFEKRYQRQVKDNGIDVVTLQDVKDVVLFSASPQFITIPIVKILHLPATERLLRALIFYCQYYLQVEETLSLRSLEKRLPSSNSIAYEKELSEDLQDMRFLIAKEYSTMILGGDRFDKYHHMGTKKTLSAPIRDAVFYETFFRLITQIVWIALGRKSGKDIEVEINRLFKSDRFNFAEHKYNFRAGKNVHEQLLMSGGCVRRDRLLKTESPLINEIFCQRPIAYRMSGIGVVKYPNLTPRLRYFKRVLILPEEEFQVVGITVGILGLSRKLFDPMLKETKQKKQPRLGSLSRKMSKVSVSTASAAPTMLFPDINLPKKSDVQEFGDELPGETYSPKPIDTVQKMKWLQKVRKRLHRKRELEANLMRRRSIVH
ncbi:protein phosphatase 1 regulatory subunit 36-like [Leguminivora glycinivorella]|uniref:protein phosphatase 1 regulatory subunit 36-like n=1 Tax=Leguminivora glycinivorella TaxID=1035111 RepID=UPI00200D4B8D|nr:protein phosphatase 1 regulatory subunit 36-like [Leguminivora glycinivorella]